MKKFPSVVDNNKKLSTTTNLLCMRIFVIFEKFFKLFLPKDWRNFGRIFKYLSQNKSLIVLAFTTSITYTNYWSVTTGK